MTFKNTASLNSGLNSNQNSNQNKKLLPALLIAATGVAAMLLPASSALAETRHAGRGDRFTVYADVIRTVPIYRDVVTRHPTEQCRTEQERYVISEGHSYRPGHNYGHNTGRHNGRHYGRGNRRSHGNGDALVGGVIGGVIGNQIGRNGSSGTRLGATIAGAIVGSVIASENSGARGHRNHSNNRHSRYNNHSSIYNSNVQYGVRPVQRCERVVHNRVEHRLDGYKVTYRHRGRTFTTTTRKDPGSQIAIRLNARPARGQ